MGEKKENNEQQNSGVDLDPVLEILLRIPKDTVSSDWDSVLSQGVGDDVSVLKSDFPLVGLIHIPLELILEGGYVEPPQKPLVWGGTRGKLGGMSGIRWIMRRQ